MAFKQSATKRNWNSVLETWAQPPSQTEQERSGRAVRAIQKAVDNSLQLQGRNIDTFVQGSYANGTNVRQDSDVDVCVMCASTFFYDLPPEITLQSIGSGPAHYTYPQYKNDVLSALAMQFKSHNLTQGKKAFHIRENTYRKVADAVACFEYRNYFYNHYGQLMYHPGTALVPDKESHFITNFPKQHYENGTAKDAATVGRFKLLVRIVKRLRNEMEENDYIVAKPIQSFLLESLAWNWPNEIYNAQSTWSGMTKEFLAFVWGGTKIDGYCASWVEVNNIKPLFAQPNKWTRQQVNDFAVAAFHYINN